MTDWAKFAEKAISDLPPPLRINGAWGMLRVLLRPGGGDDPTLEEIRAAFRVADDLIMGYKK